jgi:hypothetical protein
MDRVAFFKNVILEVLNEQIEFFAGANLEDVKFVPITDEAHNRYQLVALGWDGSKRVYNLLYHVDIIGDKIWVQEDHTEDSIAEKLVAKGVSKKDIVLAYFPDFHRKFTEYAVN